MQNLSGLGPSDDADLYDVVARMADTIEAEMRRVGLWQDRPLSPEAFQFQRAFAGDTMSYDQWLQFVMLPRVRQIIAERGQFPPASSTAAQAVREFDGRDDCNRLISLLSEFDGLFEAVDPMAGVPNRFGLRYFSFRIALFLSMLAWGVASVWLSGPISERFKGAFHPSLTQRLTLSPAGRPFGDVIIDLGADKLSDGALAPNTLTLNMSHKIGTGGFKARVLEIDLAGGVCRVLSLAREPDQPWSPAALEAWLKEEWRRDDRDASSAAFRREFEMMRQWTQRLSAARSMSELKGAIDFVSSSAGFKLSGSTAFESPAHTPDWLQNTVSCVLALLGAVPILLILLRWYRRPAAAS